MSNIFHVTQEEKDITLCYFFVTVHIWDKCLNHLFDIENTNYVSNVSSLWKFHVGVGALGNTILQS